jgi:hypothetical protein
VRQDNLQSTYELYNKKVALEREKMGLAGEGKRHHGKGAIDKRNKPKQDQKQVRCVRVCGVWYVVCGVGRRD